MAAPSRPPSRRARSVQRSCRVGPAGSPLSFGPTRHAGPLLPDAASPVVLKPNSGDSTWLMYYSSGNAVSLAVSDDGVSWRNPTPTFLPNSDDWWAFDTVRVIPSAVVSMAGVYWLYYTGFTLENAPMLGLAVSQDGRNWARIEGDDPSGALLSSPAAAPSVVVRGRRDFVMYYKSSEGGDCISLARSTDGIRWEKAGEVSFTWPEEGSAVSVVSNGNVIRDGRRGRWLMVYEGISKDGKSRGIGLAESVDGLHRWEACGEFWGKSHSMEDGPREGKSGVNSPYLVSLDGGEGWRIYYTEISKDGMIGVGMTAYGSLDLAGFKL